MKIGTTLRIAACGIAGLGACATSPQTGSSRGTVRALRYRVEVFEGTFALTHGAGEWIEELFFPDQGVICNVVAERGMLADPAVGKVVGQDYPWGTWLRPRLNAFFGSIEDRWSRRDEAAEAAEPPVEAGIPEGLAREIFRLAEATRRNRGMERELGLRMVNAGWLCIPREWAAPTR